MFKKMFLLFHFKRMNHESLKTRNFSKKKKTLNFRTTNKRYTISVNKETSVPYCKT